MSVYLSMLFTLYLVYTSGMPIQAYTVGTDVCKLKLYLFDVVLCSEGGDIICMATSKELIIWNHSSLHHDYV